MCCGGTQPLLSHWFIKGDPMHCTWCPWSWSCRSVEIAVTSVHEGTSGPALTSLMNTQRPGMQHITCANALAHMTNILPVSFLKNKQGLYSFRVHLTFPLNKYYLLNRSFDWLFFFFHVISVCSYLLFFLTDSLYCRQHTLKSSLNVNSSDLFVFLDNFNKNWPRCLP